MSKPQEGRIWATKTGQFMGQRRTWQDRPYPHGQNTAYIRDDLYEAERALNREMLVALKRVTLGARDDEHCPYCLAVGDEEEPGRVKTLEHEDDCDYAAALDLIAKAEAREKEDR